jgi:hypothetical protein
MERALYLRGDPYETSDAVFGVKSSLIITPKKVNDPEIAKKYDVSVDDWDMSWDFVLVTEEEGRKLKLERAIAALSEMGSTAKIVDGLPVADDVD